MDRARWVNGIVTALVFVAGLQTSAHAHEFPAQRRLMLEPEPNRLHALAHVSVSGAGRKLLLARIDLNRDRELSAGEKKQLTDLLVARALSGLELKVAGRALKLSGVETKLKDTGERIEMVLKGAVPLPVGETEVMLVSKPMSEKVALLVLAGVRPVIRTDRGAIKEGGFERVIRHDQTATWTIAPAPASKP